MVVWPAAMVPSRCVKRVRRQGQKAQGEDIQQVYPGATFGPALTFDCVSRRVCAWHS